jgi:hypothetical protein
MYCSSRRIRIVGAVRVCTTAERSSLEEQETVMSDAPYYVRRAAQEHDAARRSICVEAKRIHESLARSYASMARTSVAAQAI